MKKTFICIWAVLLCSLTVYCQNFTLRVAGGYAWPGFLKTENIIGPKVDPQSPDVDGLLPMADIDDSLHYMKPVYGSYGQGGNFTFAFGYQFNPYIGLELGVSYLKSKTISCDQRRQLTFQTGFGIPPQFTTLDFYMNANIKTSAFGLSLMPAVVVQGAKPGWKVYPYGRLGISLPVYGHLTHDIAIDMEDNVDSVTIALVSKDPYYLGKHVDVRLKTEGTVSIGINGAIGVAYKPLPYLAITAEVNGQYLVTRAKESKIERWDTDGKSRLAERGAYRTEFIFKDELDNTSNNAEHNSNYDPGKPKDDLRPTGPFNNLGLNVGIMFLLSKETLSKKDKEPKKP